MYGTIVAMGAVTAGSAADVRPGPLATVVAATVIVLWIAHVYAHGLGEALARARPLDRAELTAVARRELAIPLAAVAPVAALVLGALGVLRPASAVWLALGIGLAVLAVQGARYARLETLGPRQTVFVITANLALGVVIVALKALVVH